MNPKDNYVIGVDFGTLSARASVIAADSCETVAEAVCAYHVYEDQLPCGAKIAAWGALADPSEYIAALVVCVRDAVRKAQLPLASLVGIAIDATSLSLVVTDAAGTPMCLLEKWQKEPHAYIKLWKSHSAQDEADRLQRQAIRENQALLQWCGGQISSEWAYPKMLETYEQAPGLFAETAYFWDLCDWLTFYLCGQKTRNIGALCYKFNYDGLTLPDQAFLDRVSRNFGTGLQGKLAGKHLRRGDIAGYLRPQLASEMRLPAGIAVGCGSLDGHVSMVALGLNQSGDTMITIGTSGVCAVVNSVCQPIRGVCGTGWDGLIPDQCGYDSGQSSVGDTFAWFIDNQVPQRYFTAAEKTGTPVQIYLSQLAFRHPPQPDDLVALDWWNGNRCTRGNMRLRGVAQGFSLKTRTEDVYRALIESTAFGLREILENYGGQGVPIHRIRACGGIAVQNPWLMQCYANILGRPIEVSTIPNAAAAGAAITATVAAGIYRTLAEAMEAVQTRTFILYEPDASHTQAYLPLYE